MNTSLPPRSQPVWAPAASTDPVALPDKVDVVIIGAGIAGMSAAVQLSFTGLSVAMLDARTIAAGTTGSSSAKVSILHELHTHQIADRDGTDTARRYIDANRFGLDWIRRQVDHSNIDCDFETRDAYTYVIDRSNHYKIDREVNTLRAAGVDATRVTPDVAFEVASAVRVADQAQFDPVKFLAGLQSQLEADCGTVHTGITATGVAESRSTVTVRTNRGSIQCRYVVVATGLPFLDRGLFFARTEPKTSYTIAVDTETDPPDGMFLSADGPTRSLRTATLDDDRRVLLVGGEGHKTGQGGNTLENYERLARWTNEHFGVREVTHRFSTHDYTTPDQRPYVGPLHPATSKVFVMIGFNKWGFTNATAGAHLIAAHIGHLTLPEWAPMMNSNRLGLSGAKDLVSANANVAAHLAGGWAAALPGRAKPKPGHGHVARRGLSVTATSADDHGTQCSVSGFCTHLGAAVAWNPAESTWDCPLHGSRFARTGEMLHGPAVDDLDRK